MPPLLKFTGALATLIIAVNIHAAGEPAAMGYQHAFGTTLRDFDLSLDVVG